MTGTEEFFKTHCLHPVLSLGNISFTFGSRCTSLWFSGLRSTQMQTAIF